MQNASRFVSGSGKDTAALTTSPAANVAVMSPEWHRSEPAEVLALLQTSSVGLDDSDAATRLREHGNNELVETGSKHPLKLLWEQLTAVMVLILIGAAVLSLFLGKYIEAGAILAIVILFAVLGFIQEYRAERAIAALKKLAMPTVRAFRCGALKEISARELVPGDVIAIETGNLVPADVRIIESVNLRIQEAALTGESEPIEKHIHAIDKAELPLGDRCNMGYMGTLVSYGRGTAVVVETGMRTQLGKIAGMLQNVKEEITPLQQRLDQVGKQLAIAGIIVAAIVMGIGVLAGETVADMILTAISIAVAVIPEGLPAVVTFTLALGAQRMLKRQALVRKLPAVETLGSVTTICSDKTGTLTENRMTVTMVAVPGRTADLSEVMAEVMAEAEAEGSGNGSSLALLLAGGALCNDASLRTGADQSRPEAIGDPTEGALLLAAERAKLHKDNLQLAMPRVAELPFDSERKRMTTVHRRASQDQGRALPPDLAAVWGASGVAPDAPFIAITKGAVDGLLDIATHVWEGGRAEPLTAERRHAIEAANEQMAGHGMRVLGVGFRPLASLDAMGNAESELILAGVVGMIDPPRPEVRDAVATCRQAGIRPVMITGDHPLTASYIARELGIADDSTVVTGAQLDRMSEAELAAASEKSSVFARVSPEHKLRLVEALQGKGHIVAMTGDGVNDAPALKRADIGVAMGITGTDVSKEAAQMVLRDDNFATIVASVEEGRVIYDNLRRFVKFVVAGNVGKVAVMLLWPVLFVASGLPLDSAAVALLPLQLLWLNLMADGLLGLGLGVEKAELEVMQRPPHSPASGLFANGMGWQVIWTGALIGALGLAVGFGYYAAGLPQWQTMLVVTLALLQVFQALATRSTTRSLFRIGIASNPVMLGVALFVTGLQVVAIYTPFGGFLGLMPLSAVDLLVAVGAGALLFGAIELEKVVLGRRHTQQQTGEKRDVRSSAALRTPAQA